MNQQEIKAINMMRSRRFQPSEIAQRTGVSLIWMEAKAEAMGMRPLTVAGVKHGK
jgi:hypothetical protein